jgi:hypothetical protein
VTAAHCGNCGASLHGPWCAQCGQHAHESARSFGALLHDGWHTLTHLDGRVWSTFWTLLLRPGFLTAEYFAERRQRYLPPVRLYLVMSVLFFALVSFELPDSGAVTTLPAADARRAAGAPSAEVGTRAATICRVRTDIPLIADLLRIPAMQRGCIRALQTGGRSLLETLRQNVPRMMFVFLPLLAAAMLLLYWWPRRLYIEHLVFFLHNHAALFLAFILLAALQQAAEWLPALDPLATAGTWLISLYAPWYVLRAMRCYYAQGRLLTLLKFVLMGVVYCACLVLTLLGTAFVSLAQA